MNLPLAAVGVLMFFAFLAHVLAGLRETLSIRPSFVRGPGRGVDAASDKLEQNWMQALCAFQLVTVDLLALTGLSFLLALPEVLPQRRLLAFALGGFFALWGVAWLVQLIAVRAPRRNYLLLGHWMLWFACAGLAAWGAQSL